MTKNNNISQRSLCLYFQVHQPMRVKRYRFFQIGSDHYYYDDFLNRSIIERVAEKCYIPANKTIFDLIKKHKGAFKVAYSISGTVIDQLEKYAPKVLDSFRELSETGCVEFLAETYSHSLAALKDEKEFRNQVEMHALKIERLFGQKPTAFRNTELVYSDNIGEMIYQMGYETMLVEGAKHILGWKSPNYIYKNPDEPGLKLLMRNYRLSDDIAFRFSNRDWAEWPLTTEKFCSWINNIESDEPAVNIFMDYETFGEHQWEETGIFDFLKNLPDQVLTNTDLVFRTPSEITALNEAASFVHATHPVSWADEERDLTAWLGNELQDDAFENLYAIAPHLYECKDPSILKDWQYLQNSDHFYYMCTKWFSDGNVHNYFTPFDSPYDAYINYMNVLSDFEIRVKEICECNDKKEKKEVVNVKLTTGGKEQYSKLKEKDESIVKSKVPVWDIEQIPKTKLKIALRKLDPFALFVLISNGDLGLESKIKKSLGKRVLMKIDAYAAEKKKVSKRDVAKYKKQLLKAINED